jgi:adenylate kinase family enzyme
VTAGAVASPLAGAERIVVVGCGGAGKSHLARRIAAATGLPLVHLDREFWRPGWRPTPIPEWIDRVAALAAAPRWIMDGSYVRTLRLRLARADAAVFLDLPTALCLLRGVRRVVSHYGRARPDMSEGCPERLDFTFLRWILRYRRTDRPYIVEALAGFDGRAVTLTSARAVRRFAASLAPPAG